MASTPPTAPNFSPVTQVLDTSTVTAPQERVSEEQFNTLHASSVTYRDLLIFEERLKLNMVRLKKRQQKYEGTIDFAEVRLRRLFMMMVSSIP
ncbi:hypothetical protein BGX24_009946 [Mortierella sp. AD032]|nr:hypothetical protein BGX24_009946 [Mortierella sp. AD032]